MQTTTSRFTTHYMMNSIHSFILCLVSRPCMSSNNKLTLYELSINNNFFLYKSMIRSTDENELFFSFNWFTCDNDISKIKLQIGQEFSILFYFLRDFPSNTHTQKTEKTQKIHKNIKVYKKHSQWHLSSLASGAVNSII